MAGGALMATIERRDDGTLIRQEPDPFSAGELRQRHGISPTFHEECGYAWAAHDNKNRANRLPFGCPSESAARAAYGDK
jgi:hypothetical protein